MTKPKLTLKEAKLVKATIEGKNQTEAGLEADPNRKPETARVWANEALQKPTVQQAIQDAMAKMGISPERIVKPISDALDAVKQNQFTGEIDPDHSIRLNAAKTAASFYGLKQGGDININFNQIADKEREEFGI